MAISNSCFRWHEEESARIELGWWLGSRRVTGGGQWLAVRTHTIVGIMCFAILTPAPACTHGDKSRDRGGGVEGGADWWPDSGWKWSSAIGAGIDYTAQGINYGVGRGEW